MIEFDKGNRMDTLTTPDIRSFVATDNRSAARIEALLDDGGRSRNLRRALIGIIVLVGIAIGWSIVAQIDELARARGEVRLGGRVQSLQSEEGGTIIKLDVKEGEAVKAGQVIAEFAASDIEKLRTQTAIKLNALAIDRERLLAVGTGRRPDFSKYVNDYPILVEQAEIAYREQVANRDATDAAKRSEGGQSGAMLGGAQREVALIQREIAENQERLGRLEEGARKGFVSKNALSDARLQAISLEQRLSGAIAQVASLQSNLRGNSAEVGRLRADFNQQVSLELGQVTEKYRELEAESKALQTRNQRLQIRSPIDGVVMNLPQTAVGAVVGPGGVVAEVVPLGQEILMDVMVAPRDIGFVKIGQRAYVKIDSFDSARFGAVEGKVKSVAPTSTRPKQDGQPFYKVEIVLRSPFVGNSSHRLIPGMTGEADIATGSKSVMQFLLKPLFTATDTAFHEH